MTSDAEITAWRDLVSAHLGRWQFRAVGHDGRPPEWCARRWLSGEHGPAEDIGGEWITAASPDDLGRLIGQDGAGT